VDFVGPGGQQGPGQLGRGGSRGHHVVDDADPAAAQIQPGREGAGQVVQALLEAEAPLGRRASGPPGAAAEHRNPQPARHRQGERQRLVVPAPGQPSQRQGYGDERVRPRFAIVGIDGGLGQQQSQGAPFHHAHVILELPDPAGDRAFVAQWRDRTRIGRRPRVADRTGLCQPRRHRLAAAYAGIEVPRECRQAVFAQVEVLARRRAAVAEQAGAREQRSQESVQHGSTVPRPARKAQASSAPGAVRRTPAGSDSAPVTVT
jgi:hypothetical protein